MIFFTSKFSILVMLEALTNVGSISQPFGLHQEYEKHLPRGYQYEHETMWWPCMINTTYTSKNVINMVLVN